MNLPDNFTFDKIKLIKMMDDGFFIDERCTQKIPCYSPIKFESSVHEVDKEAPLSFMYKVHAELCLIANTIVSEQEYNLLNYKLNATIQGKRAILFELFKEVDDKLIKLQQDIDTLLIHVQPEIAEYLLKYINEVRNMYKI